MTEKQKKRHDSYILNRDKEIQNATKWQKENPLKKKQIEKKWRDKNVKGFKIRFFILNRDNFTCQYCGRKSPNVVLHVDHIIPRSKGGTSNKNNLITACMECNLGKSDSLLIN